MYKWNRLENIKHRESYFLFEANSRAVRVTSAISVSNTSNCSR